MTLPSIPVSPTTTGQDEINDRRHYRLMPLGKMSMNDLSKIIIPERVRFIGRGALNGAFKKTRGLVNGKDERVINLSTNALIIDDMDTYFKHKGPFQ